MKTYIIGAGASKAYTSSPTGCSMPIANDFFKTFQKLDISSDLRVLIGDIINIGQQDFNININDFFTSSFDIEDFHTYIETKLLEQMKEDSIWKNKTFDHINLNAKQLYRAIQYIGRNPSMAGRKTMKTACRYGRLGRSSVGDLTGTHRADLLCKTSPERPIENPSWIKS